MNSIDITSIIKLHHVSESPEAQAFLEQQKERLTHPLCKHCGQHTEKYRITQKKGNTCQRCSKHKNCMKVKMWYYQKQGYVELYNKMLHQYNSMYVK